MYSLTTISPPGEEPVQLEDAKRHLRIDHTEEDLLINGWIVAARELTEKYTGKRWITQGLRLVLSCWPEDGMIRLPVEPIASIDLVKYLDVGGSEVEIDAADYQTWLDHSPPLILPAPKKYWPLVEFGRVNPITIEFTAGGEADEVPEQVRTAILLCLGNWDENRGDQNVVIAKGLPPAAKFNLDQLWTGSYP